MKLASLAALMLLASPPAAEPETTQPEQQAQQSEFVGVYDGSSFETYMAIRLSADGTFEWVLAVGGLDLQSKGQWVERGGRVHFTTTPTPIPPEFRFLHLGDLDPEAEQTVQVFVTDAKGRPFPAASTQVDCANGTRISEFVMGSDAYYEDYTPEPCDTPIAVTVEPDFGNVEGQRFDLAQLGWKPGKSLHLQFLPNDIGVLDLTGMRGTLADGVLTVEGPLGREEFRKMSPD